MATIKKDIFSNIGTFDKICQNIYGEAGEFYRNRLENLIDLHISTFLTKEFEVYSSPGRIEVIGNHTDHNGGRVVAAAISVDTLAVVSDRNDTSIEIKSANYPMLKIDTQNLVLNEKEFGTSHAIVKGICKYYLDHGKKIGSFSASTVSNVPKGAGVSSSSAFELLVAEILNVKYNDGKLDSIFKAKASQYAEKFYFGKPCGLMDQSAISLGGVNIIDFKDFENPIVKNADWKFEDLDIFVIATGGDHCDLTDDYAAIVSEMREVSNFFGKNLLIEISENEFNSKIEELKSKVSPRALLRAKHFYEENRRVDDMLNAINQNKEKDFLELVNQSGLSSRYNLQNLVSAKTNDKTLENALDVVEKVEGVVAKRVHGGGFAGTILVFVKKEFEKTAKAQFDKIFGGENVFKLTVRQQGAERLY